MDRGEERRKEHWKEMKDNQESCQAPVWVSVMRGKRRRRGFVVGFQLCCGLKALL